MADFFDKTGNEVIDNIIDTVAAGINTLKNGNIPYNENRYRLMDDVNTGVAAIGAYHAMSDILSSENPQVAYKSLLNANNGLDREFYQMVAQQMAAFEMTNAFQHAELPSHQGIRETGQFIHMDMTSPSIPDSQKLNAIYYSVENGSDNLLALMSDENVVIKEPQLKAMFNLIEKDIEGKTPSDIQILAYHAVKNALNTISEMNDIRTRKTECPAFDGEDVHGYKAGSIAPYVSFDDMIKSVKHYDLGDNNRYYDESGIREHLDQVQSGKIISDDFSEGYFQNILVNQKLSMSTNKYLDSLHNPANNMSFAEIQSVLKKELKKDRGLGQEFYHTISNDYVVNKLVEDSKSYPECPVPSREELSLMNPEVRQLYDSYEKFGIKGMIDDVSLYRKISPDLIDIALNSNRDRTPTDLFLRGVLLDIQKADASMKHTWDSKGPLLCLNGDVTEPKTYIDNDDDNWRNHDGSAPDKKLIDTITAGVTNRLQKFLNHGKTLNVGSQNLVAKLTDHVKNVRDNVATNIQAVKQQTIDDVRARLKDGSSQVKFQSQNTLKAGLGKFMNAKTYTTSKSSNLMDKLKGHYVSFMEKVGNKIQQKQNKLIDYKNKALIALDDLVINNRVNRTIASSFREAKNTFKDTRDTFNYIRNMKDLSKQAASDMMKMGQNVAFSNSYANVQYTGATVSINMNPPTFKMDGLVSAVNSLKTPAPDKEHNNIQNVALAM